LADYYGQETTVTDHYLLEDGGGAYLLETSNGVPATPMRRIWAEELKRRKLELEQEEAIAILLSMI